VIKTGYILPLLLLLCSQTGIAADPASDPDRDILITFENNGASAINGGVSAPYRNRIRYSIAADAKKNADDIAAQFSLLEIDHWPIRSLSIYCFVYRIPDGSNRDEIIDLIKNDDRIETVQPLQEFETGTDSRLTYNDKYVKLQHGLDVLDIPLAHQYSQGKDVRIAIIDSDVDIRHEDLVGRVDRIRVFVDPDRKSDMNHGTAVTSVIGANANNSAGIVGIAPAADLELFVSCWSVEHSENAVCDTFTLARALDTLLEKPPHVLNLSLSGPDDALIERLIEKIVAAGVIIVAARTDIPDSDNHFPAHLDSVIGVGSSEQNLLASNVRSDSLGRAGDLSAPGNQIMVAIPGNAYDFRSGSSLAAAHVSGVIALLLANNPDLEFDTVRKILTASQTAAISGTTSVNACLALQILNNEMICF
jgi:subtilisin family serine protease